jgi:hypothetical protein
LEEQAHTVERAALLEADKDFVAERGVGGGLDGAARGGTCRDYDRDEIGTCWQGEVLAQCIFAAKNAKVAQAGRDGRCGQCLVANAR